MLFFFESKLTDLLFKPSDFLCLLYNLRIFALDVWI